MTIAEQIAHDFLESVEKIIVANKLDIKSLETNISYSSKDEVKLEIADEKTGIIIATMKCNFDTRRIKRKIKENELENYCCDYFCGNCIFEEQSPCIQNKIELEEATNEEIDECYRKMIENDKRRDC